MQLSTTTSSLSRSQCVTLACLLEAIAPKPGNVHRGADFEDMSFSDFAVSAVASGPILGRAIESGVGPAVLATIEATQTLVGRNTNLGMVLLLAPLAACSAEVDFPGEVSQILTGLSPQDAELVYRAISLAAPAGLGKVDQFDVTGPPPADLLRAMRTASDTDLVAYQYASGFETVLTEVVPAIQHGLQELLTLSQTIVHVQMMLMSKYPDSLIGRKNGRKVANQSAALAAEVLAAGAPQGEAYQRKLAELDFWLRSDGHRRNPGTTADLITAGIYVALRSNLIPTPFP